MSFGKALRLTHTIKETESKKRNEKRRMRSSRTSTPAASSEHLYRELCQETKAVYRHDVVKMLRKGVVQVVIERGTVDESMNVLAKLLREVPRDVVIVDIRQEDRTPLVTDIPSHRTKKKNQKNNKAKSRRRGDSVDILVSKLIRGLSQMLRSSECSLQSVRLSGISMTGSNMKRLSSGVANSTSLKHLVIERSDVNDLDFGVLCRALKDQTSILILSVNRCNLTDTAFHDVQRLVKNQCLRRDHQQWLTGLRDGEVDRVALRGLQVLDLSGHDGITDRTGEILAKTLMYDHWITEINLCETNIGTLGIKAILKVLGNKNDTLRGLQIQSTRVDDSIMLRLHAKLAEREPLDSVIFEALSMLPGNMFTKRKTKNKNKNTKKNTKPASSPIKKMQQQQRILLPPGGAEAAHAVLAHWLSKKLLTRNHFERLRDTIEPISSKQVLKYLSSSTVKSNSSSISDERPTKTSSSSNDTLKVEILSSRVEFLLKRIDELERGTTFQQHHHEETKRMNGSLKSLTNVKIDDLRHKLRAAAYIGTSGRSLQTLFKRIDSDHNGTLSRDEFRHAIRTRIVISDTDLNALFRIIDKDHNGVVDMDEFFAFVANVDGDEKKKEEKKQEINLRSVILSDPDESEVEKDAWTDSSLIKDLRRLKSYSGDDDDLDVDNLSTHVVMSPSFIYHDNDISDLSDVDVGGNNADSGGGDDDDNDGDDDDDGDDDISKAPEVLEMSNSNLSEVTTSNSDKLIEGEEGVSFSALDAFEQDHKDDE